MRQPSVLSISVSIICACIFALVIFILVFNRHANPLTDTSVEVAPSTVEITASQVGHLKGFLHSISRELFKGTPITPNELAHDGLAFLIKLKALLVHAATNLVAQLDQKTLASIMVVLLLVYLAKYLLSAALNYVYISYKITKGVTLSWHNVSVDVRPMLSLTPKRLLSQVSGEALPGDVIAILGPSGCGKSTLLNALSGRSEGYVFGQILVNGKNREYSSFNSLLGYVEQVNNINPYFSVRETLENMAALKIYTSAEERRKTVDEIIQLLQLDTCAHTIVGVISGGQKKRLAVGLELISDPQVLFLDEPTSGLDSSLSFQLIYAICMIAKKKKKTILLTIHQPREDIFHLFPKVLLLSQGSTVFFGTIKEGSSFFFWNWIRNSKNINIADYFLDAISLDTSTPSKTRSSQNQISRLKSAWARKRVHFSPRVAYFPSLPKPKPTLPILRQGIILTHFHYRTWSLKALQDLLPGIGIFAMLGYSTGLSAISLPFLMIFLKLPAKLHDYFSSVVSGRRSNLYSPLIYLVTELIVNYLVFFGAILVGYLIPQYMHISNNRIQPSALYSPLGIRKLAFLAMASLYYLLYTSAVSYLAYTKMAYTIANTILQTIFLFDSTPLFNILLQTFPNLPTAIFDGIRYMNFAVHTNRAFVSLADPVRFRQVVIHIGKQCGILFIALLLSFLYSTSPAIYLKTYSPL